MLQQVIKRPALQYASKNEILGMAGLAQGFPGWLPSMLKGKFVFNIKAGGFDLSLFRIALIAFSAVLVPLTFAQPDARIQDNSFLVEEAYNQEFGVRSAHQQFHLSRRLPGLGLHFHAGMARHWHPPPAQLYPHRLAPGFVRFARCSASATSC